MRRRQFLGGLAGAVSAWPLAAKAQKAERLRRIAILIPGTEESESQARLGAFMQGLQQLGWTIGRNLRIDTRWATGNIAEVRRHAAELVALGPDVVLAQGTVTVAVLLQLSRAVPIVFPAAIDPVGAGIVDSLARPGGNVTGFETLEYNLSGKWLELLKQIAPNVTRAAVLRVSEVAAGVGQLTALETVAPSFGLELTAVDVRNAAEIEHDVSAFAGKQNGGLVITASPPAISYRELIITLAAKHRLPAVYFERAFVVAGGLAAYGPDFIDQFRRSAGYVDRILRGEKPADLPVQAPARYELVINLKTAKALGLTAPPSLLTRADEVIE